MKKTVTAIVLFAIVAVSAACSGSSSKSAKDLYASYTKHYGYVADAFGTDLHESFDEYVSDLDDCEPIDGETTAMVALLVGATLSDHGDDVATFVRDTNALLAAVKAEGLCGSATPTTEAPTTTTTQYIPPTTTTTAPYYVYGSAQADSCYGEMWDGLKDLSDNVVLLAELSGTAITASSRATINEGLKTMQDTVNICKPYVSADFSKNSQEIVDLTKELVRLHTS